MHYSTAYSMHYALQYSVQHAVQQTPDTCSEEPESMIMGQQLIPA